MLLTEYEFEFAFTDGSVRTESAHSIEEAYGKIIRKHFHFRTKKIGVKQIVIVEPMDGVRVTLGIVPINYKAEREIFMGKGWGAIAEVGDLLYMKQFGSARAFVYDGGAFYVLVWVKATNDIRFPDGYTISSDPYKSDKMFSNPMDLIRYSEQVTWVRLAEEWDDNE